MRRNILHIIYITVFTAALLLAVIAFIQNLRPVISIINSQKRIMGVPTTAAQLDSLTTSLKPYKKFAFIFSAMYIPAILFFAYMASLRILAVCKRQMPKFILPAVAAANIILLFAALFMVNNVGGGLGLAEKFENTAKYYSWYNAPVFTAGSNIYYFAPTFYTIIMPLVFLGILPMITGLKSLLTKNK